MIHGLLGNARQLFDVASFFDVAISSPPLPTLRCCYSRSTLLTGSSVPALNPQQTVRLVICTKSVATSTSEMPQPQTGLTI